MFCHCSGMHRRFEVGGRPQHAAVEVCATFHDAADIAYIREIALDDVGATCVQSLRSIVVASDHRADRDPFPPQAFNDFKPYSSNLSCGACHEHGACDGTRLICCGIIRPPRSPQVPSRRLRKSTSGRVCFRRVNDAFLKFRRFERQWLQMDVLTSPHRRFFQSGWYAHAGLLTLPCCGGRTRWRTRPSGPAELDQPRDRCRPSGWWGRRSAGARRPRWSERCP